MNAPLALRTRRRLVVAIAALLLSPDAASGGGSAVPSQRLRGPAVVRGFVGGEAHDGYTIRVRQGQTLSVRLSWRVEGANHAWFTVSESPDFFTAPQVDFGRALDGRTWTGRVPGTRDYHIYVVAHPMAHYRLEVGVR